MNGQVVAQIVMGHGDFDQLFDNRIEWARYMDGTPKGPEFGTRQQISDGRFILWGPAGSEAGYPSPGWKWSYWTDSYISVILARGFLDAWGEEYQVASDEGGGGWVVLSDYDWQQAAVGTPQ